MAAALRARGLGTGARVAIRLRPGIGLLTAIVGVLRAGAAFVPVDTEDAGRRAHRMLASIDIGLVVYGEPPPAGFPPGAGLDELIAEGGPAGSSLDVAPPEPTATAYVIFTSGSTGEPKAVPVSRRALAGYLDWAVTTYVPPGPHGVPLFTSIAFDLTLTSVLAPLAAGRTVRIAGAEQGVTGLTTMLARGEQFVFVKLTPSHLRLLLATLDAPLTAGSVGHLVIGGEQLPADLVRAWRRLCPGTVVVNEYGPTEATVGCCVHEIDPSDEVPSPVPIGRPIPGVLLRVLDERGDPVPDGVPGELYIGGPCLADGYLGQPRLTEQRFVVDLLSDPLAEGPAVLYRTGDLVRWEPDGVLCYLGRNDDQLKIRGYRIEPTEIESVIRKVPGVADCAVACWQRDADDQRLVAHVVASSGTSWAKLPAAIAAYLSDRLPEYMIPARFLPVPEIPQTSAGKADRRRLASPDDLTGPAAGAG